MSALLEELRTSIAFSQVNETGCAASKPGPLGPVTPSTACDFKNNTGLNGNDLYTVVVNSKEECCGVCRNTQGCEAADFTGGNICHLKDVDQEKARNDGSIACVPSA